jgi:hypothetical protein
MVQELPSQLCMYNREPLDQFHQNFLLQQLSSKCLHPHEIKYRIALRNNLMAVLHKKEYCKKESNKLLPQRPFYNFFSYYLNHSSPLFQCSFSTLHRTLDLLNFIRYIISSTPYYDHFTFCFSLIYTNSILLRLKSEISGLCYHCLLSTCMLIALKYSDDSCTRLTAWAKVCDLPPKTLIKLERNILKLLNYNLYVSWPSFENIFKLYISDPYIGLLNHGPSLLTELSDNSINYELHTNMLKTALAAQEIQKRRENNKHVIPYTKAKALNGKNYEFSNVNSQPHLHSSTLNNYNINYKKDKIYYLNGIPLNGVFKMNNDKKANNFL